MFSLKIPIYRYARSKFCMKFFYQERIVRRRHFRFAYDIFHNLPRIELPTKTQCVIYLLAIKYWGKFFKWTVKLILSYPGGGPSVKNQHIQLLNYFSVKKYYYLNLKFLFLDCCFAMKIISGFLLHQQKQRRY